MSLLALGVLAGCTYEVDTKAPAPPPPITAYASKVPGKWALLIDSEKTAVAPEVSGPRCSRFDYHADLAAMVEKAALDAFDHVAVDVRAVDHAMSRSELASGGYTGVITLRIATRQTRVAVGDLLGGTADAHTVLAGTILVARAGQHVIDASEQSSDDAQREAGLTCDGAADAISTASNGAAQDLARKLAEQFANSSAVRAAVQPGFTP